MFEAIISSIQDNVVWVSVCVAVVVVTKIAVDIFARRSTRRILKDAERLEAQRQEELRRRIEQASRRMATAPAEQDGNIRNDLRAGILMHSVPSANRYHFEI